MQKTLALVSVLALALLAACGSQSVNLTGTWSDASAPTQACNGATLQSVTLELTQTGGGTLDGTFTFHDAYGEDVDGVGPFDGTVTPDGEVTGSTTMTDGGAGTGMPGVRFDVTGTYATDTGVLDTSFVSSDPVDCMGELVTLTVDANLTR